MALVPIRTWHYAFATPMWADMEVGEELSVVATAIAAGMLNPHLGDGVYIELGNFEVKDAQYANTSYLTNGYFVNARFKLDNILTMIHKRGVRAPPVLLDPFELYATMMRSELAPCAKFAAVPILRLLLRRSLLLRLLCALWRVKYARRKGAAMVIQAAWREAWYNPSRGLCIRRLNNELKSMLEEV